MLLIQGWVRLAPDAVEKFRVPAKAMLEATRAEDGCIHYAFAEAVDDPGLIYISERWRDKDALDAHSKSAHMGEFLKALGAIGQQSADIRLYSGEEVAKLA